MTHAALLVIGGALATCVLAALVFAPTGTAEERRLLEERKMLRALEAQRRIRAARLQREGRRRVAPAVRTTPPRPVEPVLAPDEHVGEVVSPKAEERAARRQREREAKEQAALLKSERKEEKRAQKREAKESKRVELPVEEEPPPPTLAVELEPPEVEDVPANTKPLADLPLFSWANRIDDDDQHA